LSLTLLLEMAVSGHADRIALGTRAAGLTFGGLGRNAAGGATLLRRRDARHVVFAGRNGPGFPQLLFASAIAGIPFVPVNYRLAREQLLEMIADLDRPLVVADAEYLPLLAESRDAITTDAFLAEAAAADPADPAPDDDSAPAVLLFTSGTTARPKAVVLRHEHLVAYILSTVEFGGAGEDEAALVAVPPYHIAAVGSALSNLYAGRRVIYLPDFDAEAWLRLVRDESVTTAMVVPTMLARVLEVLGDGTADVPSLGLISYGGARMPRPVLERALTAFGSAGFCNAYGLTETSSTIALLGPDEHREALGSDDEAVRQRLGSVGLPVPGIEVEIRADDGSIAPPGVSGQLWVRGAQVSGEYRGQGSVLDEGGWLDTRDRGWLDGDGYLYIEGRSDDTIIRGGENIAPAEIEDVLLRHPAVKDVAVLGRPDDEWGEKIVAVVVREPSAEAGTDADALRAFVRERLRGSRTPDEIVWCAELPHTATGKLSRRELRAQLAAT
jgi:acyl-CoA synthetase (AMP-forming)/AMP-acid ligase II